LLFVEREIHNASPDFVAISVSIVSRGRREEKARVEEGKENSIFYNSLKR
jgi:hypothetical protein